MASLVDPRPRVPRWWWPAAALVVFVAAYSLRYVVLGERAYVPELAASFRARPTLVAIHTLFGPMALVLGLINRHREWMTRSYACIFGAVTLRLWLPLLIVAHGGDFLPAYREVAWLAWVPNLAFAEWIIRRGRARRVELALGRGPAAA